MANKQFAHLRPITNKQFAHCRVVTNKQFAHCRPIGKHAICTPSPNNKLAICTLPPNNKLAICKLSPNCMRANCTMRPNFRSKRLQTAAQIFTARSLNYQFSDVLISGIPCKHIIKQLYSADVNICNGQALGTRQCINRLGI